MLTNASKIYCNSLRANKGQRTLKEMRRNTCVDITCVYKRAQDGSTSSVKKGA